MRGFGTLLLIVLLSMVIPMRISPDSKMIDTVATTDPERVVIKSDLGFMDGMANGVATVGSAIITEFSKGFHKFSDAFVKASFWGKGLRILLIPFLLIWTTILCIWTTIVWSVSMLTQPAGFGYYIGYILILIVAWGALTVKHPVRVRKTKRDD